MSTPQPTRHPLYNLHARAFRTALKISGVQIRLPGDAWRGLKCITGAVERSRHNDVVAILGKATTAVDMLREDYEKLGSIVANKSTVVIGSDNVEFTVFSPTFDDADPCVHFTAIVTGGMSET